RPGSARPAAHNPSLSGKQEQDPRRHARAAGPLRALAEVDLLPQQRDVGGQLGRERLASSFESPQSLGAGLGEPRLAVGGDSAALYPLHIALARRCLDRIRSSILCAAIQTECMTAL